MRLVAQTAPYIRKNVSVGRMMLDVLVALFPITLFSMIQNGWKGIYVFLISIVTMLFFELFIHMLIKWPKDMKIKELFTKEGFKKVFETYSINNIYAPLISAIIYSLILPANTAPYVVFIGATFGIVIGKMVFGGLGQNIFNPACAGRIFVSICFPLSYTNSGTNLDLVSGATPLASTNGGKLASFGNYSLLDLFIGNRPGSMGEVCILLILVGAIYLLIRRSADFRAMLGYIFAFSFVMLIASITYYFGVSKEKSVMEMWLYQILSGGMIFAGVFMITDPVTSPTSKFGRVYYAALAGMITALIRICGSYPEGAAFSILIMNMFTPCIDYFMRGKPNRYTWKENLILCATITLFVGIIVAYILTSKGGGSL